MKLSSHHFFNKVMWPFSFALFRISSESSINQSTWRSPPWDFCWLVFSLPMCWRCGTVALQRGLAKLRPASTTFLTPWIPTTITRSAWPRRKPTTSFQNNCSTFFPNSTPKATGSLLMETCSSFSGALNHDSLIKEKKYCKQTKKYNSFASSLFHKELRLEYKNLEHRHKRKKYHFS